MLNYPAGSLSVRSIMAASPGRLFPVRTSVWGFRETECFQWCRWILWAGSSHWEQRNQRRRTWTHGAASPSVCQLPLLIKPLAPALAEPATLRSNERRNQTRRSEVVRSGGVHRRSTGALNRLSKRLSLSQRSESELCFITALKHKINDSPEAAGVKRNQNESTSSRTDIRRLQTFTSHYRGAVSKTTTRGVHELI